MCSCLVLSKDFVLIKKKLPIMTAIKRNKVDCKNVFGILILIMFSICAYISIMGGSL